MKGQFTLYKGYHIYTEQNRFGWIARFAPAPCDENTDFMSIGGRTEEEVERIACNEINKIKAAQKPRATGYYLAPWGDTYSGMDLENGFVPSEAVWVEPETD